MEAPPIVGGDSPAAGPFRPAERQIIVHRVLNMKTSFFISVLVVTFSLFPFVGVAAADKDAKKDADAKKPQSPPTVVYLDRSLDWDLCAGGDEAHRQPLAPGVFSAGPADRRPRPTRLDHPRRLAGRPHAHRRRQRAVRFSHEIRTEYAGGNTSRLSSRFAAVQAVRAEAERRLALPGGRGGETLADEVRRGAEGGWFFGQGERVEARRQNARPHRDPPVRNDLHFAVPGGARVARGDSFRRRIARAAGRPSPRLCEPGPADGVSLASGTQGFQGPSVALCAAHGGPRRALRPGPMASRMPWP